ncbi:MAG: ABC transporter substrate-binding protein, partial [Fidelibacterota bacterium]
MKRPIKPFVFIAGFLLFCGCEQDFDPTTLNLAVASDIRGFDPALATDIRTGETMALVYDNLVHFGDQTELLPGLAISWEIDDSGTHYSFHLRQDTQFQDGERVSASDVIYSFQRVLRPETGSPQTWLFDRIVGAREFMLGEAAAVRGLRAPDDTTVIIDLSEPFAPFIQYLAMPSASIINYRQVETVKTDPAGSGPWLLDHWERDGELVFVRNEQYWGQKPKLKRLKIRVLSEVMARAAEFEAGNLDLLGVPEMDLRRYQSNQEWSGRLQAVDDLDIFYVGMNCSRPPFNDIRLRRAMNLALDRGKILKLLLNDAGQLAAGPVPPSLRKGDLEPYPYDPRKARELIVEAGYEDGLSTQLWVAGGTEMFHVLEAMQADWAAVGIQVEILRSDWNVFKTAVREGKPNLYYLNWQADYP